MTAALERLRYHVSGAIERGEAQAIAGIPAHEPAPVPPLESHCGSWVIVSKETGAAVLETFSAAVAGKVNRASYDVVTAATWLASLNGKGVQSV